MQTTTNYGLKKPDPSDAFNQQNDNDNMDIIDAKLKANEDAAAAAQSTADGAIPNAAGAVSDSNVGNRTISDAMAPTGDSGTITSLFGWLANMIKAITGKSSWRTAPATTLEAAKGHMDATTGVHGATSAATASKIAIRDAVGRAQFMDPAAAADAATKGYVDGGFVRKQTVIADGTDLNSLTSEGSYYCGTNASAATMINAPVAHAFALIVKRHAGCSQMLIDYSYSSTDPTIYTRNQYTGTWTTWKKVWTDGNLPNPAQTTAANTFTQTQVAEIDANTTVTYPLEIANNSGDWTATRKGVGLRFSRAPGDATHQYGAIVGAIESGDGSRGFLELYPGVQATPAMKVMNGSVLWIGGGYLRWNSTSGQFEQSTDGVTWKDMTSIFKNKFVKTGPVTNQGYTWTTLYSISGKKGYLENATVMGDNSLAGFRITIDGVVAYTMDLGSNSLASAYLAGFATSGSLDIYGANYSADRGLVVNNSSGFNWYNLNAGAYSPTSYPYSYALSTGSTTVPGFLASAHDPLYFDSTLLVEYISHNSGGTSLGVLIRGATQ